MNNRQLALRWVLLIIAIIVSVMAVRAAIEFSKPPVYRDIPYTAGTADESLTDPRPVGLPADEQGLQQLIAQPGHEAIDTEPADLPAHPSGTNLMRFRRVDHHLIEHTSIWSISDADHVAVASFYEQAAESAGFESAGEVRQSTDVLVRRFVRDGQVLSVRSRQASENVRVVLQLRYTVDD